jgi:hypothetical protein
MRKFMLTAHISCSVGWIGAVVCFLMLSVVGLTSPSDELVRGAYLSMNLIGWWILVPASLLALTTGVLQALGTKWGLFQHYWIVGKLLLTVFATIVLMLHQFTAIATAADRVVHSAAGIVPAVAVGPLGVQLVVDASLAAVVLFAAMVLSVYKPWGRTPYGRREQMPSLIPSPVDGWPGRGFTITLVVVAVLITVFVVAHIAGGGLGHH